MEVYDVGVPDWGLLLDRWTRGGCGLRGAQVSAKVPEVRPLCSPNLPHLDLPVLITRCSCLEARTV